MTVKKLWHRIKAIPLIGIPYEWLIGKRKVKYIMAKQKKVLTEAGMQQINVVENIMKGTNAIFYAYAGTLLGIVRDGALIKWDMDIDYGVVINESFGWEDLQRTMESAGHKKVREFAFAERVTEQTYQIGKIRVDFFGQFHLDDSMAMYSYDRLDNVQYPDMDTMSVFEEIRPKVERTKIIEINGVAVTIPENAEEFLAAIYNEDWRIPNPAWNPRSSKTSKLLEGKNGYKR